jgi:hypothetical protein
MCQRPRAETEGLQVNQQEAIHCCKRKRFIVYHKFRHATSSLAPSDPDVWTHQLLPYLMASLAQCQEYRASLIMPSNARVRSTGYEMPFSDHFVARAAS